ncbi:sensor histidine kinase [Piscinibacter terrae]|uniref:Sensor histidine kinase n=1 Tax=Piscinibacter terrae TaxID=2496871 RepID=A0A3N7HV73_9BURK|nr:histidine kinase [Albitalea terrae]RQP25743.1 sensor histidine kinase [Albitalea terrae]
MAFFDPVTPYNSRQRRFAVRGLRSVTIAAVISLLFSGIYGTKVMPTTVYAMSYTLGCWFFIDAGRILASRFVHRHDPGNIAFGNWPGWKLMIVVVLVGTLVGAIAGNELGNLLTGYDNPSFINTHNMRQALGVLLFSLVPGSFATYFFYTKERLALSEAQAQTARRQAAETQLKLLESQLEPHMLFNTLANLRVLIGLDPVRAQAMLDRLIAFLRATLEASRRGSHPLSSEFARIGDYLELMKIRMGERLQPVLKLPPELADQPVPPLLLQPLVENAIKHGLEPHVDGGRLIVSAEREGDMLLLKVRDTGAGLGKSGADGTHFGLKQVRERLATLHDGKAMLELADADDADGGVVATVRLPAK